MAARSNRSRALCIFLTLLSLFLIGTVVVLSTVVAYFGVDSKDVITESEMLLYERLAQEARLAEPINAGHQEVVTPTEPIDDDDALGTARVGHDADVDGSIDDEAYISDMVERALYNSTTGAALREGAVASGLAQKPRIPKIIHQTWKTDVLPERWAKVRQGCMDMHPDYEYKLWSDAASRQFIAEHYPWFVQAFDSYPYPIQRADAIRYFVLHHYGGVYMDLDVGCRRSMDPLLYFQVILPATIPVGVSNDIMLSEKGHPFMDLVIHNLVTFNHRYGTNYPTVMFSTGPMFLSAQYGLWPKEVELTGPEREVRILPRRWYGKNAPVDEMQDSYFEHFYGSSWHADDAGFITFLGKFGLGLMYIGVTVVILGVARMIWNKSSFVRKASPRPNGPIALPFNVPADALPFTRPGTPGSRPGSPFVNYRSSTPTGRSRKDDGAPARGGVLYYMPVWFMPSNDASRATVPTSPTTPASGWSQYLPYSDEAADHRYQPIPPFSRPPSPSNNSILHAPGAHHDGAFDGVHLHTIASNPPSAPASPSPPAYATLKNWGTSFFRSSVSSASPVLPTVAPSEPALADQHAQQYGHSHSRSHGGGHVRSASAVSRSDSHARSRSPLPPKYSTPREGHASSSADVGSGSDEEVFDGAVESEVDKLLLEMEPSVSHSRNPSSTSEE